MGHVYNGLPVEIVIDMAMFTMRYDTYVEFSKLMPKLAEPHRLIKARQTLIMCHKRTTHTEYSLGGYIHNEGNEPAYVCPEVTKWAKYGKLHRDGDLPAVVSVNGNKEYWKNGKKHRDRDQSGEPRPAVIFGVGHWEYWENGRELRQAIP